MLLKMYAITHLEQKSTPGQKQNADNSSEDVRMRGSMADAHMKFSSQLSITSELDVHTLVNAEAN